MSRCSTSPPLHERRALLKAPDPKRAIDRFWPDATGGDQARARTQIRELLRPRNRCQ
ncbi:MAG: hypothetical protein WKG07_05800 [Hymenobacter sp.]